MPLLAHLCALYTEQANRKPPNLLHDDVSMKNVFEPMALSRPFAQIALAQPMGEAALVARRGAPEALVEAMATLADGAWAPRPILVRVRSCARRL